MGFGGETFTEIIEAWDGLGVVVRYDPPTGTLAVAIQSRNLPDIRQIVPCGGHLRRF